MLLFITHRMHLSTKGHLQWQKRSWGEVADRSQGKPREDKCNLILRIPDCVDPILWAVCCKYMT